MIQDARKWNLGLAQLGAFMQFVREPFEQEQVEEYHRIVTILEEASGEDLSHFRIDTAAMRPEQLAAELVTDFSGRPSRPIYSAKDRCNPGHFRSRLVGLANYLPTMRGGRTSGEKRQSEDVKPSTIANYTVNVEHMHNSALMQGSSGGTINQHFDIQSEEFKDFVDDLRQHLADLSLSDIDRAQASADISTVQAQINAPKPKYAMVRECMTSLRTILENAAGSFIAATLIAKINGYFPS